jgi:hypothetical protein
MAENPRKDSFKQSIMEAMRKVGPGVYLTRAQLVAAARTRTPELFDDDEPCYPGCKAKHAKWQHEFGRAIYDLTQTVPRKIANPQGRRGLYELVEPNRWTAPPLTR